MTAAAGDQKKKYGRRAIETSHLYDSELDRWHVMIASALADIERRLKSASLLRQVGRALRPMPKGENPPALPPISYP
jgi:hypothetical protein